jgi:ABC-type glycerol-3-phosphate transport system substrate-binding protein
MLLLVLIDIPIGTPTNSIFLKGESEMNEKVQKPISRRKFLRTAAGFAAGTAGLSVLAACAPPAAGPSGDTQPGSQPAAKEPVKIMTWTWYTETENEYNKACEDFNSAQSDIIAENRVYGSSEYLQVLEAAIAGGKGPDILGPHVHAIEYGLAGQTIDLIPAFGEDFLTKFFPSTRRQFTVEGKQYAIGWMAQTFGFFYNPALFEQVGLSATPEIWEDIVDIAPKFKEAGIIPWAFNNADKWLGCDFYLPLITQATDNPDLVYELDDHVDPNVSWDSQPVVDSLKKFDMLVKGKVFQDGVNGTNWDQSTALFYSGKAAMFFAGSWVPAGIVQNAPPEFAQSYRVFKTPAWATGKRHWCGNQAGAALAVYSKGNVDESVTFLKYLYDDERYSEIMNSSFSMPSTIQAAEKVDDPIMKEMTSWLPDGAPHILFGKGSWDAVSNNVQALTGELMTPEQVAAQIEADVVAARSR